MTGREAAFSPGQGSATAGVVVAVLLAVIVVVGAWLIVAGGIGRPTITVNDHTDNAVPTVDLLVPDRPDAA